MGLRKQFINSFVFSTWDCAAGLNINNNNNNCIIICSLDVNCLPMLILQLNFISHLTITCCLFGVVTMNNFFRNSLIFYEVSGIHHNSSKAGGSGK